MKPRIVATVTADSTAELRRQRDEVRGADLVELRLDGVRDLSVAGALAGRTGPVIVTCRPTWEGGRFAGSEEERKAILREALSLGAEYVDIEWKAGFDDLLKRRAGQQAIVSMHDFAGLPPDLSDRIRAMRATGAEIVKIAVQVGSLRDLIPLREIGLRESRADGFVLIGMGDAGLLTRVLPRRVGSAWTYAGLQSDIGQISLESLLYDYRVNALGDSTALYGLTGWPVGHSVSPAMHNAAFQAARLDAVYLPFPCRDAGEFVDFGRAFGLRGASVTIPHKVSLCERVDELYPSARYVGAINTVRAVDGRWIGANTDIGGLIAPLSRRGIALNGARVAVIGAGGSARAAATGLSSSGAKVTIHARNRQRAEAVASVAGGVGVGLELPARDSWDLLVNCTPVGMHPNVDDTPIPSELLGGRIVFDLVYNPPVTRLMREAQRAGCRTIGGLEMLVAQACEQFEWWTSTRPRADVMRDAAMRRLAAFADA